MADINQILGRNINSVKELKQAIKDLQNSLIGVDTESEQFRATSQQLAAAQDELTKVTRAGKDENVAAKDSLAGMRQEYKNLYDQYKMLTEEQRKSDFGKNMADSLKELSDKINDTQKGVGDFRSNIGRYAEDITKAFNGMGISIGGLKAPLDMAKSASGGLNTAFKTLAANPVMLAITAIVAILVKAAAAIKNNEELTNRLHQAMSTFQPVLDLISKGFDVLAGVIVKTVEGFAKLSSKVLSIIPGMKQAIKSHQDLAKATDELTKKQRENAVVNSQKEADIERLREEASATEDVVEKRRLLEEAKEKQAEIDRASIEIAQEELRILQEYAEKTADSAEENEKLAAAQKKVNEAIAQGERNQRSYNKQIQATTKSLKEQASAGKSVWEQETEELEKFNKEYEESLLTQEQKTDRHYKRLLDMARKHGQDTANIEAAWANDRKKISDEVFQSRISEAQTESQFYNQFYSKQIEQAENERERAALILDVAAYNYERFKQLNAELNSMSVLAGVSGVTDEIKRIVEMMNAELGLDIAFPPEINQGNIKEFLANVNRFSKDLEKEVDKAGQQLDRALSFEPLKEEWDAFREKVIKDRHDLDEEFAKGVYTFDEYYLKIAEMEASNLQKEIDYQKRILENQTLTAEQRLEVEESYYENLARMREAQAQAEELQSQRSQELTEAAAEHYDAYHDSLSSILGTWKSITQAQIDNGNLDEKETKRREKRMKAIEKIQLALSLSTIASQTAQGIMGVWQGYASELPVNSETAAATGAGAVAAKAAFDAKSLTSALLRTSMIAAQGTAQVAAAIGGYISKSNGGTTGSDGTGAVATVPAVIDSTPYSYTRTLQTKEEYDEINNRPIWVSVEDISSGLEHQAVVRNESSF